MDALIDKLKLMKFNYPVILQRPDDTYLREMTTAQTTWPKQPVDLLVVFVETMAEFKQVVARVWQEQLLVENGLLYVAYPKKGNTKYQTFVHRDEIFPALQVGEDGYIEATTLKFNRMVRLDDIFTVVGIKNSAPKKGRKVVSSSVKDYLRFLPEVEKIVAEDADIAAFFHGLSPGYQRDWARYIFSGKQSATQEKRKAEMLMILKQGYKSKDLFRQGKK